MISFTFYTIFSSKSNFSYLLTYHISTFLWKIEWKNSFYLITLTLWSPERRVIYPNDGLRKEKPYTCDNKVILMMFVSMATTSHCCHGKKIWYHFKEECALCWCPYQSYWSSYFFLCTNTTQYEKGLF